MITEQDIRDRLSYILSIRGDDEAAHSAEDQLHRDVLKAIANGCERPAAMADLALLTVGVNFERWCA